MQPHLAPPNDATRTTLGHWLHSLFTVSPWLLLIVQVTAFNFLGIATPSEPAAMNAVATLDVAALYQRLTWGTLKKALTSAMTSLTMMLLVIVGSTEFGQLLTASGAKYSLVAWVLPLSYLHLSNRNKLAVTYGQDLTDCAWLDDRRDHVTQMVLSYCALVRPSP